MSTSRTAAGTEPEKSFFEQQRDELVSEIALSLEHVLMNMNLLNRSLEGVIAVGKEFESVEALWSQFENVMGKNPEEARAGGEEEEDTTLRGVEDRRGKQPAR
ncbi:Dolichyl-diphosphooligosaccharide-protein glycosyltransferase subunit dad1 [Maublancomyces gigas]|uniref:DASH complex subunit DAD1 n=1 Tax=Discina gigas TaxID=1032678 RepID=A0ABR3GEP5_9PEZI